MGKNVIHPKVTVFMTVYNGEDYLRSAMESILKQTFQDFEFVIVNDGSTDKTREILRSFHDTRIKIVENATNQGLVASRNFGLKIARGKYIAIMDADDISIRTRIEKQVAFLDSHPNIGACGSWIRTTGEDSGYVNKYYTDPEIIKANLLFYTSLAQPSIMLRSETLRVNNLHYNKENQHCEDYGLWIDISHASNLANLPDILLLYRVHKKGYSKAHKNEGFNDAIKLREKELFSFDLLPTKDDLRIHSAYTPEKNESVIDFLEKVEVWYQKINESNAQAMKYTPTALNFVLYERWRTVCGMNAKAGGFLVWKKYQSSPLFKIGGTKKYWDSAKILIKSLMGK